MAVRLDAGRRPLAAPRGAPATGTIGPPPPLGLEAFGAALQNIGAVRAHKKQAQANAAARLGAAQTMAAFRSAQDQALQKQQDQISGNPAGFADAQISQFDADAKKLVAATPPPQQGNVQAALMRYKEAYAATARTIERAHNRAFLHRGAIDAIEQNAKGLVVAPNMAALAAARGDIANITAGLPGDLATKVREEALGRFGGAYIAGMQDKAPDALLRQLQDGALDDFVDAKGKAQSIRSTKAELARRARAAAAQAKARAAAALAAQKQQDSMARITIGDIGKNNLALLADTGTADPRFDFNDYARLFGAKRAADYEKDMAMARASHAVTAAFAHMSTAQIHEAVQGLQPKPGPHYAAQKAFYDSVQDQADKVLNLRQDDPLAAVSGVPAVQQALAAAQVAASPPAPAPDGVAEALAAVVDGVAGTNGADPAAVQQAQAHYYDTALAAQAAQGIPAERRAVMAKARAHDLVDAVAKGPENERVQRLRALIDSTAQYGRHRDLALRQLVEAGLPNDAQALILFDGDPKNQTLLARALQNHDKLKGLIAPLDKKDIDEAVAQALTPMEATVAGYDNGAQIITMMRAAAGLMAQNEVALHGARPQAAARAAAAAIAGQYSFAGRYRIPRRIGAQKVSVLENVRAVADPRLTHSMTTPVRTDRLIESGARLVQDVLSQQSHQRLKRGLASAALSIELGQIISIGAPPDTVAPGLVRTLPGIDPRLGGGAAHDASADAIANAGFWQTASGDGGLNLMLDAFGVASPVLTTNGRPVRLRWAQLAALGKIARETPPGQSVRAAVRNALAPMLEAGQ